MFWKQYCPHTVYAHVHVDALTVVPSYLCEISNLRPRPSSTTTTSRPHNSTTTAVDHHIELFIFLEDINHQERDGLGKNSQWKEGIELHHKLRKSFQNLAVQHSRRFHRAVHSALNKLICNYGSHAKVQCMVDF